MFSITRGKNQNHSFTTLNEVIAEKSLPPINNERKFMINSQKTIINELSQIGVTNIPNFCQSMKTYGMNRTQISEYLEQILYFLNIHISLRFISKSNSSEKNMIFTWICKKYPIDIIEILYKFISEKKINPKNKIDLRNEISSKIIQIKEQGNNILSNKQIEKQEIKQEPSKEQPQTTSNLLDINTINFNLLNDMENDDINDFDDQDCYFDYNPNIDHFPDY